MQYSNLHLNNIREESIHQIADTKINENVFLREPII